MNSAKVVVAEPQAESGPVVLPLLAEAVREPRESANIGPHGEILPLHVRRADTFRIGFAHNWDHLRGNHLSR